MIDLVIIPSVFDKSRRQRRSITAGEVSYVADVLEREGLCADGWAISRHGAIVGPTEVVRDGDEIVALSVPQGVELGATLLYGLVSSALSVGAAFLIGALFGAQDEPQDAGSQTYAWSGIENAVVQGGYVPLIYGTHRVGGQIIAHWHKADNSTLDDYLHLLLALGEGPINQVGQYTDDQDSLVGVEIFSDDFGVTRMDLANSPNWTRAWGSSGDMKPTSDKLEEFGSGACGYIVRDVGQVNDNCYVEADFETFVSGSTPGIAINAADSSNYYVARYASATSIELVSVISGTPTVLHTESGLTLPVRVHLRRHSGTVKLRIDNVTVYSAAGSGSLTADDIGVLGLGVSTTGSKIDDFEGGPFDTDEASTVIRNMHINGLQAKTFDGVSCWLRMGRQDQQAIPGFDERIQNVPVGITLSTDYTIVDVKEPNVTEVDINLHFPKGLFRINSSGEYASAGVRVRYAWRPDTTSDWEDITVVQLFSEHVTSDPDGIHPDPDGEYLIEAFSYTLSISGMSGTAPQVRVKRVGAGNDDSVTNEVVFDSLNEINGADSHTYPGVALVGVKIKATDQLSGGSIPAITNLVKGLSVPVWEGGGSAAEPNLQHKFSDNPAWVMTDLLLNRLHGLGNWIRVEDLDWQSFYDFAAYCDETLTYHEELNDPAFVTDNTEAVSATDTTVVVDVTADANEFSVGDYCRVEYEFSNKITGKTDLGGGRTQFTLQRAVRNSYIAGWNFYKLEYSGSEVSETRHTFDGVFDEGERIQDALIAVARCGRAMPVLLGNQHRVRWQDERTPVQTFTAGNIIADSWERDFIFDGEQIHIMEVQFANEDLDYEQDVEPAGVLPSINSREAPVEKQVRLKGIVRSTHARREAMFLQRASQLLSKRIKFRAPAGAIACEVGDVIQVSHHRFVNTALISGRATGTLAEIILDQDVTLAPATTYKVVIVKPSDGTSVEPTVTEASGSYPAGTAISTDGSSSIDLTDDPVGRTSGGATYALGEAAEYISRWEVLALRVIDPHQLIVEIDAVEYDADVYDDTNDHLPECETVITCGGCGDLCLDVLATVLLEWWAYQTSCATDCDDCTQTESGSATLTYVSYIAGVIRWEGDDNAFAELDCSDETWTYALPDGANSGVAELGVCACLGSSQVTEDCTSYLEEEECPPNPGGTYVPVVRITRNEYTP